MADLKDSFKELKSIIDDLITEIEDSSNLDSDVQATLVEELDSMLESARFCIMQLM